MADQMVVLAGVSVLGMLEQAYFALQVIYSRRKHSVSPPAVTGPPEFERIFRAQANCCEYFPIFIISLWIAGVFFSQGVAALLGLLYLSGRYRYFWGYVSSAQGRLAPLYFCARLQWALLALAAVGVVGSWTRVYLGLDLLHPRFWF